MKKITAGLLAASIVAASLAPVAANAESAQKSTTQTESSSGPGLTAAIGLGALAGVAGFNLLALGVGALPGGMAYGVGGALAVPAEMSVAMSRVYATASAATGAYIADYIYTSNGPHPEEAGSLVNPRLLAVGAGAITGIAAFNVATAGIATVPLAGAALAPVPMDIALGSRFVAALSGGVGAVAGLLAHDAATGEKHSGRQILTLAAGATAGVATGNYLVGWGGTLPLSSAATAEASLAGNFASSAGQAASRVYVITSGVLGAWLADALFGVR